MDVDDLGSPELQGRLYAMLVLGSQHGSTPEDRQLFADSLKMAGELLRREMGDREFIRFHNKTVTEARKCSG